MQELKSIKGFKQLGYIVQPPSLTDKTYFMVKQGKNGTKRIYITITKSIAKIYAYENNKDCELDKKEKALINSLVFEDLNLTWYEYLK